MVIKLTALSDKYIFAIESCRPPEVAGHHGASEGPGLAARAGARREHAGPHQAPRRHAQVRLGEGDGRRRPRRQGCSTNDVRFGWGGYWPKRRLLHELNLS